MAPHSETPLGRLRVLVVSPSYAPGYKAGGVQRSVTALVATSPSDVEVLVVAADRDTDDDTPYAGLSGRVVPRDGARVLYLDPGEPRHWWRLIRHARAFRPHVLYLNSLWNPAFGMVPALLAALRVIPADTVVTAPRGQLHGGALATGSRLKALVLPAWRLWARRGHHAFHCTDDAEVAAVRAQVPAARCVVSLDPIELPRAPAPYRPAAARQQLEIVHLSRVSRKKNHDTLLRALALVRAPVRLRVIGPLEDKAFVAELRTLVAALPRHVSVEFTGPVPPGTVRDHFAEADVFAFPTLGENFGHVIPEALSASCPVLAGPLTPFGDTLRAGGGEVLDPTDPGAWADAIDRWAALTPEEMTAAHERAGRAYTGWFDERDSSHVFDLFRGLV